MVGKHGGEKKPESVAAGAAKTVLGVAIILALRFHWWSALGLAVIFLAQFFITDTAGRYWLSLLQIVVAVVALWIHRRDIIPTVMAPFARPSSVQRTRDPDPASRSS